MRWSYQTSKRKLLGYFQIEMPGYIVAKRASMRSFKQSERLCSHCDQVKVWWLTMVPYTTRLHAGAHMVFANIRKFTLNLVLSKIVY